MKMMRYFIGILCLGGLLAITSCHKTTVTAQLGNWVKRSPFKGHARSGAFSFVIGNAAYVGLGYDQKDLKYLTDSYVYDLDSAYWKKIADFPGTLREKAVAFSVNGKGYVGTGYRRDTLSAYAQMKDFWEYDPVANTWTRIQDFAGNARYNAVAFSDGKYGYVGTGYDGDYYGDFFRFDPASGNWHEVPDYPGDKREQASTMIIDGKVYLLGGTNNGVLLIDIWQFDPESLSWTNKTPLTTDGQYANFKLAVARYDAVAFTVNNQGYIATGSNGQYLTSTYQYDPTALTWTLMTPYERASRSQAVSFVLDGRPFITTGSNAGGQFDNMDEFVPAADYDIND